MFHIGHPSSVNSSSFATSSFVVVEVMLIVHHSRSFVSWYKNCLNLEQTLAFLVATITIITAQLAITLQMVEWAIE
jgi:hypothetical protein